MRPALAALLAVAAGLLGGCSFGGDEPAERVQQPTVLSAAAVERQPAGSPERTLFEWWRAMQFGELESGAGLYSAALNITPSELDRNTTAFNARPALVEAEEQADRATVRVLLESRARNPNGRVDVLRTPRAFELVRERGQWRLADNAYLEGAVRDQQALAEALRRQAAGGEP